MTGPAWRRRWLRPSARSLCRGPSGLRSSAGVAANKRIRADLERACREKGIKLYLPPLSLCGDNGAMIGCQAYYEYLAGVRGDMSLNAYANLEI